MLLRYYDLREQPFGVTPDPRYLYASSTHREALASILYGIDSGLGFIALTAKPGMGKTTLLFEVLQRIEAKAKTVFLFQTISDPEDLSRAILMDLGVTDIAATHIERQAQLNEALVAHSATGKRLVLAIDEAQRLDEPVLEAVRVLSNFETSRQKLIQIVLSGQPELAEKLALPQLLQLRQRISIFGRLDPLSQAETAEYINHRLQVAGRNAAEPIFTKSALALICRYSEGIPRNINNICFNALSLGYAVQSKSIDSALIREVAADLNLDIAEGPVSVRKAMSGSDVLPLASHQPAAKGLYVQPKYAALFAVSLAVVVVALVLWLRTPELPHHAPSSEITASAKSSDSAASASGGEVKPLAPASEKSGDSPATASGSVAKRLAPASAKSSDSPSAASGSEVKPLASASESKIKVIVVRKGETLGKLCAETLGECNQAALQEILRINPSIHDADYIESGQRISIPVSIPTSTVGK